MSNLHIMHTIIYKDMCACKLWLKSNDSCSRQNLPTRTDDVYTLIIVAFFNNFILSGLGFSDLQCIIFRNGNNSQRGRTKVVMLEFNIVIVHM